MRFKADTRRFMVWMRRKNVPRKMRRWLGTMYSTLRNLAATLFAHVQRRPYFCSALVMSVTAGVLIKVLWPIIGDALLPLIVGVGVLLGLVQEFAMALKPNRWEPHHEGF